MKTAATARLGVFLVAMVFASLAADTRNGSADGPLQFLEPTVRLGHHDQQVLARGATIAKTLDAAGRALVVFAASRIQTTPTQFIASMRDIARIWRGRNVPRTGRLSENGDGDDLADLAETRLANVDLEAARDCTPGDCDIKLSDSEIARIRRAVRDREAEWQPRTQTAFRNILLERLQSYRRGGLSQIGPFHDHHEIIEPQAVFRQLLEDAWIIKKHANAAVSYLDAYPRAPLPPRAEDHLYWLETVRSPKPTLQAAHQVIQNGPPETVEGGSVIEVAVLTRQVFATHYVNGSIALTLLVRAADDSRYLVYINRIATDGLDDWLSALRRYFIGRRVRSATGAAFTELKKNIELNAL